MTLASNIKKLRLFIIFGSVIFLGIIWLNVNSSSAAPPRCYTDFGNFSVAPTTHNCPSPGRDGRTVYVGSDGAAISGAPRDDECYARTEAGGGSFSTVTYTRRGCSDLESLRIAAGRTECIAEGGTWRYAGITSDGTEYGHYCDNPRGGNAPGGSIPEPQYIEDDCQGERDDEGNVINNNLNAESCGIIGYITLFIQVLSGLAGVVIAGSIIYGGIQYSAAGSDPQKVSAAKARIRNAIIALVFFVFGLGFLNWLVPGGVL